MWVALYVDLGTSLRPAISVEYFPHHYLWVTIFSFADPGEERTRQKMRRFGSVGGKGGTGQAEGGAQIMQTV